MKNPVKKLNGNKKNNIDNKSNMLKENQAILGRKISTKYIANCELF